MLKSGLEGIGNTISSAIPSIPTGISEPFRMSQTLGFAVTAGSGSACGPTGWKQSYFS